jgi:hypothetical protein
MDEHCQFLDKCPMFKYFNRAAQKVYIQVYCKGNFASCARRRLRLAGEAVPVNLMPHGSKLWKDGAAPPEFWD